MAIDSSNVVVIVIRGIYILAAVAGLACNPQVRRLLSQACAAVSVAVKKVSHWRCRVRESGETSEADLLTASRMEQLRVEHFKYICYPVALFVVLANIGVISDELKRVRSSNHADVLQTICHGVAVFLAVCPGIISSRNLDAIYGSLALASAVYVSPWALRHDTFDRFVGVLVYMNLGVFVLNLLRRSFLASLMFNLVFAAGVSSTMALHGPSIASYPDRVVFFQIVVAFLYPATAQILDYSMWVSIRNGLEMQGIHELLDAACALLRGCCEVVLELNADGVIVSEASELGGFLLQGPGRCFRGRSLADFIADVQDREAFLEKLCSPPPSERLAQAMHVRIRDANREFVKVELLWFGFRHLDGQKRYMLGLREWSEQNTCAACLARSRQEGPQKNAAGSLPPRADDTENLSDASNECVQAFAMVDATVDGLPIKQCSEGFRCRIGRLPQGSCLTDIVQGGGETFETWVQESLCDAFVLVDSQESLAQEDGAEERWAQQPRFNHWQQTPRSPKCHLTLIVRQRKLDAKCRLKLPPGEPADLENVQVIFSQLEWEHDRRRRLSETSERRTPLTTDPLRGTPTTHASL